MTRYTVEYRRLCTYTNKWREWTVYYQSFDKGDAMDAYCRHVSAYPKEQCRLAVWPEEPQEIVYEFAPYEEPDEEEQAA